ncbi:MAG: hypothetical protein ISS65_00525 [Desulfobacterales bacterium]|nr:hypothetical protein [Desulfobacterales bacterium]
MTEIDLQNKTRTELLELYKKHLGDEDLYSVANLDDIRVKVTEQVDIFNRLRAKENYFKDMSEKDFKVACEKYRVEFDPDISHDRIISDLVVAKDLENLRSQLSALPFSADFQRKSTDESEEDIRANLAKLMMLNESKDSDSDSDSDAHIRLENQKIHTKNKIRRQYGLEDLPLMLHNSDLENLILLDNGMMGDTCREFLNKCKPPEKQNYESRIRQIINLRQIEREALEREALFLREVNITFGKLKVVPEKIVHKQGRPLISEIYGTWFADVQTFHRKLSNKAKAYKAIGEKPTEFYRILQTVSEIMEKEKI